MSLDFLTPRSAAQRLGISVTTLYDWLGRADAGFLTLHGRRVTIRYYQTGAKGQGRIQIEASEVDRIREAMRVQSKRISGRPPKTVPNSLPGITVSLGRPIALSMGQ